MDSLISRYRNISILLLAILVQLVLLAYQVKSNQDVRLIRVWAVTAVTPMAKGLESGRSSVAWFLRNYIFLQNAQQENGQLKRELNRLKLENQFLKTELGTADRAQALAAFQARTPSRTVAARIIGTAAGANSKVVFVDRGATAGVTKGMAVVTADGIVGKVVASYITASQVQLITDSGFAAGVVSQKNRVFGTLRGLGYAACRVDYVQNEEKVEAGEWFYTSGDDRVFPRGLPVGRARIVRNGASFKDIFVEPSGPQGPLEEVLIVLEGVHQQIPDTMQASPQIYLNPPPAAEAGTQPAPEPSKAQTDADRLREKYLSIGNAQGHKFGDINSRPPNFNLDPAAAAKPAVPPSVSPPSTSPPKEAGGQATRANPSP